MGASGSRFFACGGCSFRAGFSTGGGLSAILGTIFSGAWGFTMIFASETGFSAAGAFSSDGSSSFFSPEKTVVILLSASLIPFFRNPNIGSPELFLELTRFCAQILKRLRELMLLLRHFLCLIFEQFLHLLKRLPHDDARTNIYEKHVLIRELCFCKNPVRKRQKNLRSLLQSADLLEALLRGNQLSQTLFHELKMLLDLLHLLVHHLEFNEFFTLARHGRIKSKWV